MKTIKLINTKNGWMAKFVNDATIIALFGSDTIPTAFTEKASPMMVKKEIEAKNVGYNVVFA